MARRAEDGQKGFVITLELVLIFTVLGIGLFVGLVAIRNALFVWWQNKKSHTVWVYDSALDGTGAAAPNVMGPVRDFDEHEAPRFFFVDRALSDPEGDPGDFLADPAWMGANYRAFIGVRDDRFTSRHRILFTDATCGAEGGTPCIAAAGRESDDSFWIGTPSVAEAGGIGYLYPMQSASGLPPALFVAGPSYGIGPDDGDVGDRLPGWLYRQSSETCEGDILSAWESQRVTGSEPCVPFVIVSTIGALSCPSGLQGNSCSTHQGNVPACEPTLGGCNCPSGWVRVPDTNSSSCCPAGSEFDNQGGGQCKRGGGITQAVPVSVFNSVDWTTPFRVNLPPDPSQFFLLEPTTGEGSPIVPSATPYDPSQPMNFDVPPGSNETGPP